MVCLAPYTVIRPIIEGDVKYQRFQLAHESLNGM